MIADDLISYDGLKNPLPGTQGALVQLRSGEMAVLPPRETDEYDLETETLWYRANDADDIIAYRPLPITRADKLTRLVSKYLAFEEYLRLDFLHGSQDLNGTHPIDQAMLASLRKELREAADLYKHEWPSCPQLQSLRRLRHWGDEDEDE